VTHIYIKPSSNQHSTTSREASAAGRLRPNAFIGEVGTRRKLSNPHPNSHDSGRKVDAGSGKLFRSWGERRGLNPRPSVPQTDALPAELRSPPPMFYWLFCDLLILLVPTFVPKLNAIWARRFRVWPFDFCIL
jgi:hypothetical protein